MDTVVTGSSGTVGTAVMEHLDGHELTPVDTEPHPDHDTVVADVSEADSIGPVLEGHDAAVHLAFNTELNAGVKEVGWTAALAENLRATCTVLEAALETDMEAVVLASSNHAVGMYEVELAPELYFDSDVLVDPMEPPRPDGPYGAVKCFDEALGRFCAEYHGLRVYAIRIGSLGGPDRDTPYAGAETAVERGSEEYERKVARQKAMWHSRRDFAHMVDCCLTADDVPFGIYHGISGNDRRWLGLENAFDEIDYRPRDNGDEWSGPTG